jgi:hypothetical protein
MPVQVIWGMEDRDLLPACLDGLEDICPDLRIARLPGWGIFRPGPERGRFVKLWKDF